MSSQLEQSNSELKNPLKERIKLLMTEEELNKPYSFATRVGLSKGTFTGIWVEGRTSLHQKTIDKIALATGANPAWLSTGIGEPFESKTPVGYGYQGNTTHTATGVASPVSTYKVEASLNEKLTEQLETDTLDVALLQKAFETLVQALNATGRVMQPKGVSRFVATVYASLKENEDMDTEVLQDCILTVEEALKSTRRTMSPKAKSDLILVIYELYSGNASYKEAMASTINQLIRSVS